MGRTKVDRSALSAGKPVREFLTDLYEQYGSQVKVAAAIGISQGRLSQIIKERGLREKTILVKENPCPN